MKQNNLFKDFTKKYQLSKTLRFLVAQKGSLKKKGL